jgi:hypothetical protein
MLALIVVANERNKNSNNLKGKRARDMLRRGKLTVQVFLATP